MFRFIARRLLQTIPVLLVIITATFFMVRFVPGGPFTSEKALPPEILRNIEAHYGLDIPWGDLDFTLRASRQLEKGEQLLPGSAFEDNNGENGEPEWVGNLNTTFTSGPFSVNWGLRYVDATSNLDDFTEANPRTWLWRASSACTA